MLKDDESADATRQLGEIDELQKLLEARERTLKLAHIALLSEMEQMSAGFTPGTVDDIRSVIEVRNNEMEKHHRIEFHSVAIIQPGEFFSEQKPFPNAKQRSYRWRAHPITQRIQPCGW